MVVKQKVSGERRKKSEEKKIKSSFWLLFLIIFRLRERKIHKQFGAAYENSPKSIANYRKTTKKNNNTYTHEKKKKPKRNIPKEYLSYTYGRA